MMKKIILAFVWMLVASLSHAQLLHRPLNTPCLSMGAYSLHHADVFSFTSNVASLSRLNNTSAAVFGERKFLLAELNNYHAAAALPTHSGNFGIKTAYSGFSGYNETQLGLAYARKLDKKIDIGIQFNYHGISITGYGDASAISFEIATILHLSEKLHAGLHAGNPVGGKLGNNHQEKLVSVYHFGLGYEASEKFTMSVEIVKEEEQPVNVNAGFQYKLLPQLWMRTGLATATSSLCLGFGLTWKLCQAGILISHHPQLGITPGLLLLFSFKGNKNE